MRYRNYWMVAVLMIGALSLVIFTRAFADETETGYSEPALVEPIEGTALNRVTLTQKAAERLGVETAAVEGRGGRRRAGEGPPILRGPLRRKRRHMDIHESRTVGLYSPPDQHRPR